MNQRRVILHSAIFLSLVMLLAGCGRNAEADAAITKACGHFDSNQGVKDIFGMEQDFAHLARLDVQYFRLSELATNYITSFKEAIDSNVANPIYPKVPRALIIFCENG